jgi:hypothetical protein
MMALGNMQFVMCGEAATYVQSNIAKTIATCFSNGSECNPFLELSEVSRQNRIGS